MAASGCQTLVGLFLLGRLPSVACFSCGACPSTAVAAATASSRATAPLCVSTFERYNPHVKEMRETAKRISRRGHGILPTDESPPTAGKRLGTVGLPNPEESRRAFRELLYTTPGLEQYISGIVMFDETLYQTTADGTRFTTLLQDAGIEFGVKVDTGLQPLAGTDGETATQGLDGLAERCQAYYAEGARFTKWRAVFKIGAGMPSERAITENAHTLGRYASICQEHGLVPIVEPEVTLSPGDYPIERAAYESQRVLSHVFRALNAHDVRAGLTLTLT
jgi:fructose-bisphosphate aldolase class I